MGVIKMTELYVELQEAGPSEDLLRTPGLLDQLKAEFERVPAALDTMLVVAPR